MGIDRKYGRVMTELGSIGTDEPVIVFRAQDKLALLVIEAYKVMCRDAGSPPHHLDGLDGAYRQFAEWQAENLTKVPESA